MLVMLLPGQIPDRWEMIKFGVERALLPTVDVTPEVINNILMSLLDGSAQCWVEYRVEGEKSIVYGLLITTVTEDFLSGTRNLLIYALFGTRPIDDIIWVEGLETLTKFARFNRCKKVTAYSNVERIEEIVESLGGKVEWKFISFPV